MGLAYHTVRSFNYGGSQCFNDPKGFKMWEAHNKMEETNIHNPNISTRNRHGKIVDLMVFKRTSVTDFGCRHCLKYFRKIIAYSCPLKPSEEKSAKCVGWIPPFTWCLLNQFTPWFLVENRSRTIGIRFRYLSRSTNRHSESKSQMAFVHAVSTTTTASPIQFL